jgi:hypothetical protein
VPASWASWAWLKQQLAGGFERLGVIHLAGGGNAVEIGCGHLLDDLAARRHLGEMGRSLTRAGRLPSGDHRAGEEHLAVVDLPLGQVVAGDEGESGRSLAAGKERRELLDDAGAEAQRGKILLVDAKRRRP